MAKPRQLLLAIIDLRGGAGVYCRLLADALHQTYPDDFAVSLLVWREAGLLDEDRTRFKRIDVLGTDVHTDFRRFFEPIQQRRLFRHKIDQGDSDVIIGVGSYANLMLTNVVRDRPILLTEHFHVSERLKHSSHARAIRWLMRRQYRGQTIIVPTQRAADDLRQNFGLSNVRAIAHGVDGDRIRKLADERVDLPAERYFIAVGRLSRQKNYPLMLDAFAAARTRGAREHLVIIGDGEDRAAIEARLRDSNLTDVVHLLGHRDNPFPYIKHATALVLASFWEGFGLVLIEAMNLGVPCIATDCPSGPAEILDGSKYGLLVPTENSGALSSALVKITQPGMRDRYSAASSQRAADFTLTKMAEQYRPLLS
ncbi:MAG TPA: glycosyltransferase [Tepidisphaeraceae bacterium]|nr:glycosyltransferase [Tepidisphaeraceae bacterium]